MIAKVLVVLVCLGAVGCMFPTDSCACVRVMPSGVVEGRVVHASGAAAAGVFITISVAATSCPVTSYAARLVSPPTTVTSDAGEYTLHVAVGGDARTACVRIAAQPPAGPAVVAVPVTLTLGTTQADRVRVDIKIPD